MASKLMVKRGTTASWAKSNTAQDTTLSPGQLGIEYKTDGTSRVKVGPDNDLHSPTEWEDIPRYLSPDPSLYTDTGISLKSNSVNQDLAITNGFVNGSDIPSATNRRISLDVPWQSGPYGGVFDFGLVVESIGSGPPEFNVRPKSAAEYSYLGTSTNQWTSVYSRQVISSYLRANTGTTSTTTSSSNTLSISSGYNPFTSDGYGKSNSNIYFSMSAASKTSASSSISTYNGAFYMELFGDGICKFRPASNTGYYLGDSTNRWGHGYINKLYTSGNIDEATSTVDSPMALSFTRKENISCNTVTTPGLYMMRLGITDGPIHSGSSAVSYMSMLCMASDASASYRQYIAIKEGTTDLYVRASNTGAWKRITVASGTAAPSGTANVGDVYIQYI